MKIFFDFDGTLINSKERLHRLFLDIANCSEISYQDYWKIKRSGISNYEILRNDYSYSDKDIEYFKSIWMKKIETIEYLKFDVPFKGVNNLLANYSQHYQLYLITARQNPAMVISQINNFGWSRYFFKILVTEQIYDKSEMMKTEINKSDEVVVIGDTGKDVLSGKRIGARTVGVLSGFSNHETLKKYKPDFIIDSVLNLDLVKK